MRYFDTDYMEGAHPKVMQRLLETNLEHTAGYGHDQYCATAGDLVRKACGDASLDVNFLVGGTQTNAVVIDALLSRHEGVLACESAHINVHEAGAIEASGHKVLTLPAHSGKLDSAEVDAYLNAYYSDDTFEHMVAPGMVYISYPTELGTVYSRQELEKLSETCHRWNVPLYIDGARLGYGLARNGADINLPELASLCDVFYIGGTKGGALCGECVVSRKGLFKHFRPLVKQHGAMLAKGRLLGLQFAVLFTDNLYFEIAGHADRLAMELRSGFEAKGYKAAVDSPTNQQFFVLPNELIDRLHRNNSFELWGPRGESETMVRFVTSWATDEADVAALVAEL